MTTARPTGTNRSRQARPHPPSAIPDVGQVKHYEGKAEERHHLRVAEEVAGREDDHEPESPPAGQLGQARTGQRRQGACEGNAQVLGDELLLDGVEPERGERGEDQAEEPVQSRPRAPQRERGGSAEHERLERQNQRHENQEGALARQHRQPGEHELRA